MPNTTVGANAPSLPNRRAFLSLVSAAGAVSLAPAAIAEAAPPPGAAIGPCDIAASLDRWRRAVAMTCAAIERFEAADEAEIKPAMPDKLRVQRDDWHGITTFADEGFYEDGKWIARRVYGERAADEIHREKEEEMTFWQPRLGLQPWSVRRVHGSRKSSPRSTRGKLRARKRSAHLRRREPRWSRKRRRRTTPSPRSPLPPHPCRRLRRSSMCSATTTP